MDEFSCRRCGKSFPKRSRLLRHLSSQVACEPLKSHTGQKILREKLLASEPQKIRCTTCGRAYVHSSSLYRHRKTCKIASTDVLEEIKRLGQKMDELTKQLATPAYAPASVVAQSVSQAPVLTTMAAAIGAGNTINSNNLNIDASRTYNIRPWDPQNFDFERLSEAPNDLLAQSFAAKNQGETLMDQYLKLDPPNNYSLFATAPDAESMRFFDGQRYKKVADPRGMLKTGYKLFVGEIVQRMMEDESLFRWYCDLRERDFDEQKARLMAAADKPDCVEVIAEKVAAVSAKIQKVIDDKKIPVES